MPSKFFTLAISFLFLGLNTVLSQSQPTPAPTPKVGYIRFWDMLPANDGAFEVRKEGTPTPEGALLTATSYRYSGYQDFPVGRYRLDVVKKNINAIIKTFDVDLKQDGYYTILVAPGSVDMFDDTEDPKAGSATLTIRNFFPGSAVSAWYGQKQLVNALPYGRSVSASGLSFNRGTLILRTTLANGKPAESSADIDFKAAKHATALVIPDSYGRFRPRVTFDGKNL
jgi:hypothetical protein